MSIDLRVDFLSSWSAGWIAAKVLGFAASSPSMLSISFAIADPWSLF